MLVDSVLPHQPIRQWVLSVPFTLRWLFASEPRVLSKALEVVTLVISTYLVKKAGFTHKTAKTGAVTLIPRFGSALNLNIHFHMLFLDGVYELDSDGATATLPATTEPPSDGEELRGKMSWAMRLKRVFNIDVTVCRHCQGAMRIIACIEDRQVINKILAHINQKQEPLASVTAGAGIRAPPTDSNFLMT